MDMRKNEQLLVFCLNLHQGHVGHEVKQDCMIDHRSDNPRQIVTREV